MGWPEAFPGHGHLPGNHWLISVYPAIDTRVTRREARDTIIRSLFRESREASTVGRVLASEYVRVLGDPTAGSFISDHFNPNTTVCSHK
jgi:hypothetical protein